MSAAGPADLGFYVLAVAVLTPAAASTLLREPRRAVSSLLLSGAALAGLFVWLGCGLVAAVDVVIVVAGLLLRRRLAAPHNENDAAVSLWRTAVLVAAFFAVTAHAILMARWPLLAAASHPLVDGAGAASLLARLPAASLPHFLLTAVAMVSIGCFGVISRRQGLGPAMGVATMTGGAALGLAAVSRFVAGDNQGAALAALVLASTALSLTGPMLLGSHPDSDALVPASAERLATATSVLVAGVTLALLAGSW